VYHDFWCYKAIITQSSWDVQKATCEADGGWLVTVQSEEENSWVMNYMVPGRKFNIKTWIGANDNTTETVWVWERGSSTFLNWNNGEPNNFANKEDCMQMRFTGKWNDANCAAAFPAVCEKPAQFRYCPSGYAYSDVIADGRCYKLLIDAKTRNDQTTLCSSSGAHLVTVESGEENRYLKDYWAPSFSYIFLGFNDRVREGNFVWDYGTSNFTNWAIGQPDNNNNNQDCACMYSKTELWSDFRCESLHPAFCEVDKGNCGSGYFIDNDICILCSVCPFPLWEEHCHWQSDGLVKTSCECEAGWHGDHCSIANPTSTPTGEPTSYPTSPSAAPSSMPSGVPSSVPTLVPTLSFDFEPFFEISATNPVALSFKTVLSGGMEQCISLTTQGKLSSVDVDLYFGGQLSDEMASDFAVGIFEQQNRVRGVQVGGYDASFQGVDKDFIHWPDEWMSVPSGLFFSSIDLSSAAFQTGVVEVCLGNMYAGAGQVIYSGQLVLKNVSLHMNEPTSQPTVTPTLVPTPSPTTVSPTKGPTILPSVLPTTVSPTEMPTVSPTGMPTVSPTEMPTVSPTGMPTVSPTGMPTVSPTEMPTVSPTGMPTVSPTGMPTVSPTEMPTVSPTEMPTVSPTGMPTVSPTEMPVVQTCAANPFVVGNGKCNMGAANSLECGWDGGDCCEVTCLSNTDTAVLGRCGSNGYDCKDPAVTAHRVMQVDYPSTLPPHRPSHILIFS
jgi:hypothetical protein